MAWIWAALAVIVFVYLLWKLVVSSEEYKRLPPGPKGFPIIGHLHLLGKNPHHDLYRLARKHGPIMGFRLGFVPTVIISSPVGAELILKTHDLVFAGRPTLEIAKYISYDHKNLVFAPYGPYWRNMRKLCTLELLSNRRIDEFQAMRKAELNELINLLKQAAEIRETVDLSRRVSGVIGDMNCLMLFGRKYADSDLDEMGFKAVIAETMELGAKFNLADYFPYIGILDLQGLNGRMKTVSKVFDEFLERIIADHTQNKQEKQVKDFVDTMIAIMESGETGFKYDLSHVKAVLLDLLIAGMDTTASAVEWTLSELMKHPPVLKRLQEELKSVVGIGNAVEESHLNKLEYLNSVVKESLRLHPVSLFLVHESLEDCIVEGFYIPKRSRIIVNVWAIGRDQNVWQDPEMFSPERFIGSNIDLRGRDFQLIPFGAGRRSCPGMQLGLTMLLLMVAQLVHCFDWELPDGMQPSDLNMAEHVGLVTSRAEHLMAIPRYRTGV